MNKFYMLSLVIHLTVITLIFKYSKTEEIKFVRKSTMIVSVKNRSGISSSSIRNLINEKKIEKKEEQQKNINKKKIVRKIEKKRKKKIKKTTIKKIKEEKNSIEKQSKYNEFQDKNRFIQGKDGIFTAVSAQGIEYEIEKEVDPKYPIIAKKMGYRGDREVDATFLVDLNGELKEIKIISGEQSYGFKEAVIRALREWKFKPIIYKGKKIKVKFEKTFKFKR